MQSFLFPVAKPRVEIENTLLPFFCQSLRVVSTLPWNIREVQTSLFGVWQHVRNAAIKYWVAPSKFKMTATAICKLTASVF